jgi:hypothetical protein
MDSLDYLIDHRQIVHLINTLFLSLDEKEWEKVEDCFAPTVEFDISAIDRHQEKTLTPEAIVEQWKDDLNKIDAMHHQTGNYTVSLDGITAEVVCTGSSTQFRANVKGGNTLTHFGSYHLHMIRGLEEWKIDKFKFQLKFFEGNKDLRK